MTRTTRGASRIEGREPGGGPCPLGPGAYPTPNRSSSSRSARGVRKGKRLGRRPPLALAGLVLAASVLPASALAQTEVPNGWALMPSGLGAGDSFRLLFVTSTMHNAESSQIGVYNTFVQGRAAAGHAAIRQFSSRFRALGSTLSVHARFNTSTGYTSANKGVPIYWLNGSKVADDYEDFYDGTWDEEAQGRKEDGTSHTLFAERIFTGSDDDGTYHTGRGLGAPDSARVGIPGSPIEGRNPIDGGQSSGVEGELRFYGLSPVFQVSSTTTALNLSATEVDVDEGGTATFTVALGAAPAANVTVNVSSGTPAAVAVDTNSGMEGNQSTLAFTTTNWATAQTVTLVGVEDEDADDSEVTVTLSGTGVATATVTVDADDDDPETCTQTAPTAAFWSDCLTVGHRSSGGDRHGFSSGSWGALPNAASVTFGGETYRISALRQAEDGDELLIDFNSAAAPDEDIGNDWILRIGSKDYRLLDADHSASEDSWTWTATDDLTLPGWTTANVGDKVRVSLSELISDDATLSALSLGTGVTLEPAFKSDVTSYRAWVANSVSSVTVTATNNEGDATVAITGDSDTSTPKTATLSLSPGRNTVTVTVTADDGTTTETYTVTVIREAAAPTADANALLTARITVGEGTEDGAGVAGHSRVSAVGSFGALTATSFTLGENSRTVNLVALGESDAAPEAIRNKIGVCVPSLAAADLARLFWRVGDSAFAFSGATKSGDCYYRARGTLSWDYGEVVLFKIEKVPEVSKATVNGSSLVVTFDKDLDEDSVPDADDFEVKVTPRGGSEAERALAASNAVTVRGKTVTLALASPVALSDAVTVSYTVPTGEDAEPIQDVTGHDAAAFSFGTPDDLANETPASADTMLSKLSLGTDGTLVPAFANNKRAYRFWVANGVSSVTVTATRMHSGATVAITGDSDTSTPETATQSISVGRNTVTVTVTAEDDSTTGTYTVTVVREAAAPVADPDALLTATMTAGGDTAPGSGTDKLVGYGDNATLASLGALTETEFTFRGARELKAVLLAASDAEPSAIENKFVACFATTSDLPWTYLDLDIGGEVLELYRATAVPRVGACRYLDIPSGLTKWSYGDTVAVKVLRASRAPDAPAGLTATKGLPATPDGTTKIDLSWTAPTVVGTSDIEGYRIEWSADGSDGSWQDLVADTGSTGTTYSNTGLRSETTRHYRVSAINADGTGTASAAADTTTDDILPLVLVSATVPAAGDRIALVFDDDIDPDDTAGLSAFMLTGAGGAAVAIGGATVSAKTLTLTLASGTPTLKTGETVKVAYVDPSAGDDSAALQDDVGNDAASFTTGVSDVPAVTNGSTDAATAPASPGTLTARGFSPSEIDLSWSPPSYHGGRVVTAYLIEHSDDGMSFSTLVASHTTMQGGKIVTQYRHSGLTPNTTYHYRVKATNAIDTGAPTNVATALALDPLGDVDVAVSPASPDEGDTVTWTVSATSRDDVEPVAGFALEVRLASADGTATAPRDYAAVEETLNFARADFAQEDLPGVGTRWVARKTGTIAIVDDVEAEAAESFALSAEIIGTASFYVAGTVQADVEIAASDSWSLAFAAEPDRVVEGTPQDVLVSARIVPESTDCVARFPVSVRLAVGGTATGPADYGIETPPAEQEIAPCTQGVSWQLPVSALIDTEDDPGETIVFTPQIVGTQLLAPSETPSPVTVTIDEIRALVPSRDALSPDEGSRASYTLSLASRPTGPVSVTLSLSGDSDVSVSPRLMTFTRDSWNVPREVTVSAAQDADREDDEATVTHAVSGGGYAGAETRDVKVAAIDDDVSFGMLRAHISGADIGRSDPPPQMHFGRPFRVELRWSERRTGAWASPQNALREGGAIRVRGGSARAIDCRPYGSPSDRFCSHVQILELVPDGADDVVLTLEPLDCVANNPLAFCALVNGRYTGLAERQRWSFAGVSGPPDAPQRLTVSPVTKPNGDAELLVSFAPNPEGMTWRVQLQAAGGDWTAARSWSGAASGRGEQVRITGVSHANAYDVRARWENSCDDIADIQCGSGAWAEASTGSPAPPAPTGLSVAQNDDGSSVTLAWRAPAPSAARLQYRLARFPEEIGGVRTSGRTFREEDWRDIPDSGSGGANRSSYAIGGLVNTWEIRAQMRAVGTTGRAGAASAEARVPHAAPKVLESHVTVISDPGTDGLYAKGDRIEIAVRMSRPVKLHGTPPGTSLPEDGVPSVELAIGSGRHQARLVSLSQSHSWPGVLETLHRGNTLHFAFEVEAGMSDRDGFSIPAGGFRLNGARLNDLTPGSGGRAATFSLGVQKRFPDHGVDSMERRFESAERLGPHIWVHFNADLDPASRRNAVFARQFDVTFSESRILGYDVTDAHIVKGRGSQACRRSNGRAAAEEGCRTVRLTLGQALQSATGVPDPDETVQVSYTPIGSSSNPATHRNHPLAKHRLRNFAGDEVAGFGPRVATYLSAGTSPQLAVDDATGREPVCNDAGYPGCTEEKRERHVAFTVRLVPAATQTVTVDYATSNGSAKGVSPSDESEASIDKDYINTSGTLTFEPGQTEKTIEVPIRFDGGQDTGESFTLTLSNPTGDATVGDAKATGTIRNSEVALAAYFASPPEAHDGETAFTLRLTFSEEPAVDAQALLGAIAATGASVTEARQVDSTSRRAWDLAVTPSSNAAVTLSLAPAEDCTAAGALCTEDGRTLAATVEAEVAGPAPTVSQVRVTSASVTSAPGGNGTWDVGETVNAELRFGAPVTLGGSGGTNPTLGILLDGVRREAAYGGGSRSGTLSFSYAIAAGDAGARKARVASDGLSLNGASIEDGDGASVDPAFSTAPWVTGVDVQADASGDGVWTEGETLAVRLDFSESVTVAEGRPSVKVTIDGHAVPVPLSYASGSGSAALVFSEEVAEEELSAIALVADSLRLNGARIVSQASGLAAELGHPGTGGEADTTPPELVSAAVDGAALVLTWDEALDRDSVPGASAFAVRVADAARTLAETDPVTVGEIAVTLTLSSPVSRGETVTVSYTAPAGADATPIRDAAGNPAAALSGHAVANGTQGTAATAALTAAFTSVPASHGGEVFTVELEFSEEAPLSYRVLQGADGKASVIAATGGAVSRARRMDPPSNRRWAIVVEPDESGDVTLRLPATTDCQAAGAICTADARPLSAAVTASVPREVPAGAPLTVRLANLPAEHDGKSAVVFQVHFSENPPGYSYRTLRDHTLSILQDGTSVTPHVRRLEQGSNLGWEARVKPASKADLTVAIAPTTDCAAADAVCNEDGEPLSNAVSATVSGPPGLSVADARVEEAAGATVDFAVTMSRASISTVTVDYATSDGGGTRPARAGEDYSATSGTLTFAPGETEKTVAVPVLDDDHDEVEETFSLTLSNPSGGGAYLKDSEAVGTIANTDAMPLAWLARFGRTVAEQVIEAVERRFSASRSAGAEVSLAGQALSGASIQDREAREESETMARLKALSIWFKGETDEEDAQGPRPRALTARDFLGGTSFALTGGTAETGHMAIWGRGALSRFDGRAGKLKLDGEVASAMLGADFARKAGLLGLMLMHSRGSGSYRSPSSEGEVESTLTGLYPYGRHVVSERVTVWGGAGYGAGELVLTPKGQAPMKTDMDLTMGAVGVRAVAVEAPADGGLELSTTSDAMAVRTSSEAVSGRGGNLAGTKANVLLLRLGVEGTWRGIRIGGGGMLVPTLELGVRHDSGDAETGFGLDVGVGLSWSDPGSGLSADLRARGLLTHRTGGFRDRGLAGSISWNPGLGSGRGPLLTLTQTVGAAASGGMDALLGQRHLGELVANDDELERRRLRVKMGYGFGVFGDRFTATPEAELGLSDSHREYTLRWRLGLVQSGPGSLELNLEATRRERTGANDNTPPEQGILFGLTAQR